MYGTDSVPYSDVSKRMIHFVVLVVCLNKIFSYIYFLTYLCFILNTDYTHKVGLNKIFSYLEFLL